MKFILATAGCAAVLLLAGCASDNGAASSELPNVVNKAPRAPVTTTQYRSAPEFEGLSYADMNKRLGKPVLTTAQADAKAATPAKATYSLVKRLDIQNEVFYAKRGSMTVMETHPARFYETVTVVKADLDDQGVVTHAVTSTVDRLRTACQMCASFAPCEKHGCTEDECACPSPCGCAACDANKELCYRLGCNELEACKCGCMCEDACEPPAAE